MAVKTMDLPTEAKTAAYTTNTVASKDGTTISYRQLGRGPGLVILHGSMSTGYYSLQLAQLLAQSFTVYLPDRRGFGHSSSSSKEDGIQKDVEDLDALLTKTETHNVFGISAGSIIALKAALTLSAIHKLAIYEPPLFMDSAIPTAMMTRFDAEMAQNDVAAALTTTMKGAPLMSDGFSAMPRWLIKFMTKMMMSFEDGKDTGEYATFRQLAPTLHHDGQIIASMSGQQSSLSAIQAEVILLGGSKSTTFLKTALDSVAQAMPSAKRVELAGLDHSSPWNSVKRGNPQPIAQELQRFFAS